MSQQIGSAVFHEKGKVIILSTKRWGRVDELLNYSRRDRATDELSHIVHEEPQEVIFLHGIWRHIREFGIEGQIPRISSPVKLEKRC